MERTTELLEKDPRSLVVWENNHGQEMRGALLRADRHMAAFEVYAPGALLQASEVLSSFKLTVEDRTLYSGRAVVTSVVHAGTFLACEVALEENWRDLEMRPGQEAPSQLLQDFDRFIEGRGGNFRILPEYKMVVADLQILLMDLRGWLEQVEMRIRSDPSGDRLKAEREAVAMLAAPIIGTLGLAFQRFEEATKNIEPHMTAAHSAYVKRQLHPLVLCAPFMYRTFSKPLGYAGDYEMVNMMMREPWEGATLFAKALNAFFLSTPPVVAHRNRVKYLTELLIREGCQAQNRGEGLRVFNLGCGPAKEVQNFIEQSVLSHNASFTLMDFSSEALDYVRQALMEKRERFNRATKIETVKKAVGHFLKEASKPTYRPQGGGYGLVYCAGLFDYLPDHVCRRLVKLWYDMLAPGGVVVVTNVADWNPSRGWMEHVVNWHLIYRNNQQMRALVPQEVLPEDAALRAEESGVNYLLEVRKPSRV